MACHTPRLAAPRTANVARPRVRPLEPVGVARWCVADGAGQAYLRRAVLHHRVAIPPPVGTLFAGPGWRRRDDRERRVRVRRPRREGRPGQAVVGTGFRVGFQTDVDDARGHGRTVQLACRSSRCSGLEVGAQAARLALPVADDDRLPAGIRADRPGLLARQRGASLC